MKLVSAQVTNFKSIEDSGRVDLGNVTCLVGKNESGKTAFLQALHNINPVGAAGTFDLVDYPRKALPRYRAVHDRTPATVVRAELKLSPDDVHRIEASFGEGVLRSHTVAVQKDYKNARMWNVELNERVTVHHLLDAAGLPPELEHQARASATLDELTSLLKRLEEAPPASTLLLSQLQESFADGLASRIINSFLSVELPRFIYFDEYSLMRGRISLRDLRERRAANNLDRADHTFLCLLSLAGLTLEDLEREQNYNRMKIALEAASVTLTEEMFKYWSQNRQLEAEFDVAEADPSDPPPLNTGRILHIRIKNNRHRVSIPFDDRSHGFVWFFSFLSYFSQLEHTGGDLVLLLDEPGLSLHAKAQRDLLRFLDDRLATRHQVIYTTHSPFLISAAHLDRVRTVQDMDGRGTIIGTDLIQNDRDTVFPLRAALAFELAQSFFTAPHSLLVQHPSDVIYLELLSEAVWTRRRVRLDPRWTLVPVGGGEKVAAFVSLLSANQQNMAVLMDLAGPHQQRLLYTNVEGLLAKNVLPIREFTEMREADIEDLFDSAFYLALVNGAYQADLEEPLSPLALGPEGERIVAQIERYYRDRGLSVEFNRHRPASHFLVHQARLVPQLDEETIGRFAAIFERLNALLPHIEYPASAPLRRPRVQLT